MVRMPKLQWVSARDFRVAPMPVSEVTHAGWSALGRALAEGRLDLMGLWGVQAGAEAAVLDRAARRVAVARVKARRGAVPSLGALHAPAQRLERAASDLAGVRFEGAPDDRPWLDHGTWAISHPLAAGQGEATSVAAYRFLPVDGDSLHEVPVGPVHAGIIEPGHFRFTAQGETVVRLEERLGYTHKGVERLMRGADLLRGAELAGRVSGDSAVAFAWSFAQAAEAALQIEVPDRAHALRGIMAELERLANHLGDFGAICNDAAFAMMLAQTSLLREDVLRAAKTCFGHRFMRDRIVPGGVTVDLDEQGVECLRGLLDHLRNRIPALVELYDNSPSLLDRTVGTGRLDPALAARFAAGGYVGRASGRDFDTRRDLRYAPYAMLRMEVPVRQDGDVNARIWIRIQEIDQSLSLITQMLGSLPAGPVRADVSPAGQETTGLGLVEGFRGDILAWLALDADGRIARCHLRDPSWFQWPLLEAAIEGNIIADFPLCNKSFNCSYSGHDL